MPGPSAAATSEVDPARDPLRRVVQSHLETFLEEVAARNGGRPVPRFVERQFRRFIGCGLLAHGFVRWRCADCRDERLVPLACKGRGFCPRCTGRRMVERSAHLVDHVLPDLPIRQWVLSLPFELRYRLAFDHALCRAVLATFSRALRGLYRDRARQAGHGGGRTGTVTVIQRFGGALNLNVHFHTLVVDGTFREGKDGELDFIPQPRPTPTETTRLLRTIRDRIVRLLVRRGLWESGHEGPQLDLEDDAPPLAPLYEASVSQHVATGPRAGQRVRRLGVPLQQLEGEAGRGKARLNGFDLHADTRVPAGNRERLERLCRYLLRPPVARDRIEPMPGGDIRLRLKTPWSDGTTHLRLGPLELLEKLAALIPRPHINLIVYHGVFAPRHRWRKRVTSYRRSEPEASAPPPTSRNPRWAELMHRTFGVDVLECTRCGGRLRFIAIIGDNRIARRILRHLGLAPTPLEPQPARSPPSLLDAWDLGA